MGGRPLIFNDIADKADAIIYAFWLGAEAGNAIADVISGDYNPAGKLPVTFPRSVGQIPIFYNCLSTGRPVVKTTDVKYKSAYIDMLNTPRYAFGYGLSYTKFNYTNLKLDKELLQKGQNLNVSFTLTNSGEIAGEEVVQLYLQDKVATVVRPIKELKDFAKVMLKPGESKQVSFTITPDKLALYKVKEGWITEPGTFKIMLGTASDNIKLSSDFNLQ